MMKKNRFVSKILTSVKKSKEKLSDLHLFRSLVQHNREKFGDDSEKNSEYAAVSVCAGVIRTISAVLLVVFSVAILIFGRNTVSIDKVYYLFRDIYSMNSVGENDAELLNYSLPSSNQDFALYKKGLCSAGDGEIKLFTATGRVTVTLGSEMSNPRALASDSFVLIYDAGGNDFSLYNSFKKLYGESMNGKISVAAMSDKGRFAVVSSADNYRSQINLYNNNFSRIATYNKNDYVIDAKFDGSGRYLAVLSLNSSDGDFLSSITVYDTNKNKVYSSVSVHGVLSFEFDFDSSDRLFVTCSDRVLIFDKKCKQRGEYKFPDGTLKGVASGEGGVALIFENDPIYGKNTVYVVDNNGELDTSFEFIGDVLDIKYSDRYVYLLDSDSIQRVDVKNKSRFRSECFSEEAIILVCDRDKVMVCTPSFARIITQWERQ